MERPRQRSPKVGLFLTPWEDAATGQAPRWSELLATVRRAEEIGFDAIWVPDHLLLRLPERAPVGMWESWTVLAALAAATERITLGSFVTCTGYRNPGLLAKMATTVDEISDGRFVLGLGAGWHEPEFHAFGFPFDHRVSRFAEAVPIIAGLLRQGRLDFEGTYYAARDCELRPRGPRPAGPPILIGVASSGPRILGLAARYADHCNRDFAPYSLDDLAAWQTSVDAACLAADRDPATLDRSAAVLVDLPNGSPREGKGALSGSPEEIAAGLRAYAATGLTEVQVWLEPATIGGIEAFAPVLELLIPDGRQ